MKKKHNRPSKFVPTRKVHADESFAMGPIRVSRFGKYVAMENRSTEAEHKVALAKMAASFPEISARADQIADEIRGLVVNLDPLTIMHRAFWDYVGEAYRAKTESELTHRAVLLRCQLEYIQGVIVSVVPASVPSESVGEAEWTALSTKVFELYEIFLSPGYFLARSAAKASEAGYSPELDDLMTRAQMHWVGIRGERYQNHAEAHLSEILSLQTDLVAKTLGVSVDVLVTATRKMATSLTMGRFESLREFKDLHSELFQDVDPALLAEEATARGDDDPIRTLMKSKGLDEKMQAVAERAFGHGLFDIAEVTGLPSAFLDLLSLVPGESVGKRGLFDTGPMPGWPLRLRPTWDKPFLKLNGRYYLFDLYLLDRLHYLLGRIVREKSPGDAAAWNSNQKLASEAIPLDLLKRVFTGATEYKSVYYMAPPDASGKSKFCECDGLLIYDDTLFVVEVKAGAFTYTSPADDLDAHLKSIEALIVAPVEQGRRFVDYLRSADEVGLLDENRSEIGRIRQSIFRRVVVCCVTYDQLTQHAATIQFNGQFESKLSGDPVWCISVDDLRVLVDLLSSPAVFTHYLNERLASFSKESMGAALSVDEIDHVGLYIENNRYVEWLGKIRKDNAMAVIQPNAYGAIADKYFHELLIDPAAIRPSQRFPTELGIALDKLAESVKPGRLRAAHALLDLSGEARNGWADAVRNELKAQVTIDRPRIFTLAPLPISFACSVRLFDPKVISVFRSHAAMLATRTGNQEQVLLLLVGDTSGNLIGVDFEIVRLDGFSIDEIDTLKLKGIEYAVKKITDARKSGKIGRNDSCRCGSGLKFKKCCGR